MAPRSFTGSVDIPAHLRSMLVAVVAATLLLALIAGPASASSRGCSVKNEATGRTYSALQAAANAAKPKANLLVHGTCRGKTVIRKDLRVSGVRRAGWGEPRLHADAASLASNLPMLTIQRGTRVIVSSLVIQKGKGIVNRGNATLVDVGVHGGRVRRFGIFNEGTLQLLGASWVRETGGVRNAGHLTLGGTSRVRSNDGGGVLNRGTLVMKGRSNIGHNWTGTNSRSYGDPVTNEGRFVMNHRSSLSGQWGSGAVENLGTMVMNDRSSIHHNSVGGEYLYAVGGWGGGVRNKGTLVMRDHSSIHDNSATTGDPGVDDDGAGRGAGVHNSGTLVMRDRSSIHGNDAQPYTYYGSPGKGGGIFNGKGGTLVGVTCGGTLANVQANTPDDCYFAE